MTRLFKLQFLGPLALFAATLSAELAAKALAHAPDSQLLWFINLRMFGIFQRSYYALSEIFGVGVGRFQLFGIALPIFLLACYGLVAGRRLPLALASNLSFAYAAFLVWSWQSPEQSTASLGSIAVPSGAGLYVLVGIYGSSLLSFAVSHLLYIHAARSEL